MSVLLTILLIACWGLIGGLDAGAEFTALHAITFGVTLTLVAVQLWRLH